MKRVLDDTERNRIDAAVRALEERHGMQLVVAVVQRSDCYEELPWKACAFGGGNGSRAADGCAGGGQRC